MIYNRNEALDLTVYCHAALFILQRHIDRLTYRAPALRSWHNRGRHPARWCLFGFGVFVVLARVNKPCFTEFTPNLTEAILGRFTEFTPNLTEAIMMPPMPAG